MGWDNNKIKASTSTVFDVEIPNMDFSLDSVFTELKTELKEERSRKTKKRRKRVAPKPKQKSTVSEEVIYKKLKTPAEAVAELLPERTNDPLALVNTPKYMTQQEFQNHYRLLLDRIQIQLGSLGGGGAVNIRDMDDVTTEFQTNPESLDGATMKMRYLPQQKILQFYGDTSVTTGVGSVTINSGVLDILGTNSQINLTSVGGTFTASFSDTIITPGTFESVGVTALASGGDDTSTGGALRVGGTANATKFSTTSDERLKKNIRAIDHPLELLASIEGVKFDWISDDTSDVGVIAQDIERCLPELVTEFNETKTVNYNGLIGLLIESVKELSKDNQLMRMEIDSLRQ